MNHYLALEWLIWRRKKMDKKLLKILACPVCKAGVKLDKEKIVCQKCGRIYPIKDGIPIMLEEEAKIDE
jgi:uncharacterized protein